MKTLNFFKKILAGGLLSVLLLSPFTSFGQSTVALPPQPGHAGQFLQTDGLNLSWQNAGGGGGGIVEGDPITGCGANQIIYGSNTNTVDCDVNFTRFEASATNAFSVKGDLIAATDTFMALGSNLFGGLNIRGGSIRHVGTTEQAYLVAGDGSAGGDSPFLVSLGVISGGGTGNNNILIDPTFMTLTYDDGTDTTFINLDNGGVRFSFTPGDFYDFPKDNGDPNEVLTTNGAGTLTWAAAASTAPGGADTQVQYNDGGAFGGDAGLTYNETTNCLTVDSLIICRPTSESTTIGEGVGLTGGQRNVHIGYQVAASNVTGEDNVFIGDMAGTGNANGTQNVYIGSLAGRFATGGNNTYVGRLAGGQGVFNSGSENTFLGAFSGRVNTTGSSNTFLGHNAGDANTTGLSNTYVGKDTGGSSLIGSFNVYVGEGAGETGTSSTNTAVGFNSLNANVTGAGNSTLGFHAGEFITGSNSVAIGNTAGSGTNLNGNTASFGVYVGYQAGAINTTGASNTFVGGSAGDVNTTGGNNTFLGFGSGGGNQTGSDNTFLGLNAGANNTVSENTFIGSGAGDANTTGLRNTFVGYNAGGAVQTGSDHTAVGFEAGLSFNSAVPNENTLIGSRAGRALTDGAGNTFIGYQAGLLDTGSGITICIGHNSCAGTASVPGNSVFIGRQSGFTTTGIQNTFVGDGSGIGNTTGADNTLMGSQSRAGSTGSRNSIYGAASGSGSGVQVDDNTGIGYHAFNGLTTGDQNTTLGSEAGDKITTAGNNVLLGYQAGDEITTVGNVVAIGNLANSTNALAIGQSVAIGAEAGQADDIGLNVYIGYKAGEAAITNGQNVFIGHQSGMAGTTFEGGVYVGYQAGENATGNSNVIIGRNAGDGASFSGASNTLVGNTVGQALTTAAQNTFIGAASGSECTTCLRGNFLGFDGSTNANNLTDFIGLGYNAFITASNQMVVGSETSPINNIYLGSEGVTSPTPSDVTWNAGGASGTNIAPSNLTIVASKGTGTATTNGDINIATADATVSGTTLQTATNKFIFKKSGDLQIPSKGIDTTAGDAATIDSNIGRFRKDTSGATFTLTNNRITANSIITLTFASDPGIASNLFVVAGAGSATVTFQAVPLANTDVNFMVLN